MYFRVAPTRNEGDDDNNHDDDDGDDDSGGGNDDDDDEGVEDKYGKYDKYVGNADSRKCP